MSAPDGYRMASSQTYHLQAPDWVKTGRALCGRSIHAPGYLRPWDYALRSEGRMCKDCDKRHQEATP